MTILTSGTIWGIMCTLCDDNNMIFLSYRWQNVIYIIAAWHTGDQFLAYDYVIV